MTNLFRVLKYSWKNFSRNLWLSVATLFMMFVALAVVGGLFLFNASLNTFVAGLEDKVDVSVYFNKDAEESDILNIKSQLEDHNNVRFVQYTSRDEALDVFTSQHEDNEVLIESLNELDDNPLQASLNIKAHNPQQFSGVVSYIENLDNASATIDNINFKENQQVIESISNISEGATKTGIGFMAVLTVLVVFVTFNTIRLAIYTARDEIQIMKLVGGSNWFVRSPFVITGGLYGVFSGLIVLGFFFGGTWLLDTRLPLIFAELDLYGYLLSNALQFSAAIIGGGVLLGMSSSYLAVRKHLKM